MNKYAMVPINRRYIGIRRQVRRVLISYTEKDTSGIYLNSRVVYKDPYFDNPESSQKYLFEDDGFTLLSDGYNDYLQSSLLNNKRPYEYAAGLLLEPSIEFEAESDEKAIETFIDRLK